jgi:hypothetical protein
MHGIRSWLLALAFAVTTPALAAAQTAPSQPAEPDAARIRIDASTVPTAQPSGSARAARRRGGDPLRNGAIVGAIVGGLYGALGWGRVVEGAGAKAGIIMAYTAGGALIGAGVDALHAQRPSPAKRAAPRLEPTVGWSVRF